MLQSTTKFGCFRYSSRAEVMNMQPARLAKEFPAAHKHFGETSTPALSFPV